MNWSEQRIIAVLGTLTALVAAISAYFFFGPVPYQDDWILVSITDNIFSGRASWNDFWSFHNEHRLFFPKIILSYLAVWTHWDFTAVPWINLGLLAGASAALSLLTPGEKYKKIWKHPAFWAACFFTLSLRATKAALWPIMLSGYLCSATAVVAFSMIALKPLSVPRWALSAALCAVSSFSFAGGLVSWVAGAFLLWPIRRDRLFFKLAAIWVSAACLTIWLYFQNYLPAPGNPFLGLVLQNPGGFLLYFLTYTGSIFEPMPGYLFGCIGLYLAWHIARSAYRSGSPREWGLVAILAFVLGNGLLTSAGRLCFGIQSATSDRYLPISAFFWAVLGASMAANPGLLPGSAQKIRQPLALVLIGSLLILAPGHAYIAYRFKQSHVWAENTLKRGSLTRDEMAVIYYNPDQLPGKIEILKSRKMSIYRE